MSDTTTTAAPAATAPAAPATTATVEPAATVEATTTPQAPAAPTAPAGTTPPAAPAADDIPDWAKDPATAARMVKDANAEAAKERVKARDDAKAQARAELLKELGLAEAAKTVDPAELAQQLAAKDTTIRDLTIRSALSDALAEAKAKPLARAAVLGDGILQDLDPTSADFQATVNARVAEYISKNPELRASQVAAVGGADIAGGSGVTRTYTRAQLADPAFYQANKTDILAALSEGRITS